MSDQRRLLSSTGDEHEVERSLLRGLRDVAAPPDAKAETWTRLQVPLAATVAVAGGAAAAQSFTKAAAIKLGIGLLVAGSMTVGVVALWPRETPTIDSPTIVPAPSAPAPVVTPLDPGSRTAPVPEKPGTILPVQPDSKPIHPRRLEVAVAPDPLSVEAAMITEARAQLRGGDAPAALATLGRLRSRSRNGALGQEREILTIQALSALGETEAARRRARAFVTRYPDSPHAAQVRGIAHGP